MTTAAPAELSHATVSRSEIARALRAAGSIKAKTIRLALGDDRVIVTAVAHESAVRVTIDSEAASPSAEVTVPRATLARILPYCDGSIGLEIDGGLRVASGGSTFEIPASPDARPPTDHQFEDVGNSAATIDAAVLVEALRRALPFASRDMTRPVLATVALYPDNHAIAATDSYRLAIVRYGDEGPADDPVLLQVQGAASIRQLLARKLGEVTITRTQTHAHVRYEDMHWSLMIPRGRERDQTAEYPHVWKLLPDGEPDTTVKVDREDLLISARSADVVTQHNEPLRVLVDESGAAISCGRTDGAKMRRSLASATVTGEPIELGLNPSFLADLAAVAPVERLTLRMLGPLRPLNVHAARDIYLLMPIRLNV